jgi:hypothetical protein
MLMFSSSRISRFFFARLREAASTPAAAEQRSAALRYFQSQHKPLIFQRFFCRRRLLYAFCACRAAPQQFAFAATPHFSCASA